MQTIEEQRAIAMASLEQRLTAEAESDLKTARRTKCRVWLKTKLAYWINKAMYRSSFSINKAVAISSRHGMIEIDARCDYTPDFQMLLLMDKEVATKLALDLLHLTKPAEIKAAEPGG